MMEGRRTDDVRTLKNPSFIQSTGYEQGRTSRSIFPQIKSNESILKEDNRKYRSYIFQVATLDNILQQKISQNNELLMLRTAGGPQKFHDVNARQSLPITNAKKSYIKRNTLLSSQNDSHKIVGNGHGTGKVSSSKAQNLLVERQSSQRALSGNLQNEVKKFSTISQQKLLYGMKQQQQVQPQNERKSMTQPPLSEEERAIYGNRQPKGYKKLSILGRGGCALVWLAIDETSQAQVALKQFPKFSNGQPNANLDSGYREQQINKGYFNAGGQISDKFASHPGIKIFCRFLDSYEDKQDLWLVFELCGKPLSKQLYEVKGEFFKGERIYSVVHDDALFLRFEESNCKLFKILIERLAQALQLLQVSGNVHSDLKSENIMLINKDDGEIDFKIIDLGSSFPLAKINDYLETTTPEYLPPEILEFIEQKQSLSSQGQQLDITKRIHPWSLDVWSMGAILLETVIGFPLWLSYKGRILKSTISSTVQQGLFAVQGRVPKKIILKQQAFLKSLRPTLRKSFPKELCLGGLNQNEQFIDLLSGMMDLNPFNRLSPKEILSHPFLKYD